MGGLYKAWKVQSYFERLPEIGLAPKDLLAGSAITPEQVLKGEPLSLDEIAYLFDLLGARTPVDFAIQCGTHVRVSDSGLVGFAMMSAPTVRDAIGVWARYSLVAGYPMDAMLEEDDKVWRLRLSPRCYMTEAAKRFCSNISIAALMPVLENLLGRPANTLRIDLPHQSNGGIGHFAEHYSPVQHFGEGITVYTGDRRDLDQPNVEANPDVHELCLEKCQASLASFGDSPSLVHEIDRFLHACDGDFPQIATVAHIFARSTRALQRDLAKDGHTYQSIVAHVRKEKAFDLLRNGKHNIKTVSHLLGFKDPGSLRHAFKDWTGMPISSWQQRLGGDLDLALSPSDLRDGCLHQEEVAESQRL